MDKELLIIRKVKPEDARGWYVLLNKVWRDAYSHVFPEEVFIERDNVLEDRIKTFSDKMQNNSQSISCVAEYNGEIVGIMHGVIKSSYEYFSNDYADLVVLYINPKYQGLGIGKMLRKEFEKWAVDNGATKYVIGVLKENKKARKVYETWGGKLSEHESDFIRQGIGYPEVFYTYELNRS